MTSKELVQKFYESGAVINSEIKKEYIHPEIFIEWVSSTSITKMNYDQLISYTDQLQKSYTSASVKINHIVEENNTVCVRYELYMNTIENPKEEMFVANFMVIWELKEGKLFRGYQMSLLRV